MREDQEATVALSRQLESEQVVSPPKGEPSGRVELGDRPVSRQQLGVYIEAGLFEVGRTANAQLDPRVARKPLRQLRRFGDGPPYPLHRVTQVPFEAKPVPISVLNKRPVHSHYFLSR
jgi:hypothetical protein